MDSRVEKSLTRCFYDITFDKVTHLPTQVAMTILCGVKGGSKDPKLEKGEHIAFKFSYSFKGYGKVARLEIPKAVGKILR